MFKAYKGNDVDTTYVKIQGVWMRLNLDENYDSYPPEMQSCLNRVDLECLGWGYVAGQSFKFSREEKDLLVEKFKERFPFAQTPQI